MRSLIDECLPKKVKFLFAEGGPYTWKSPSRPASGI